jgi:multidrug efflux pump subunit AcrA (membrane-fusion protein)
MSPTKPTLDDLRIERRKEPSRDSSKSYAIIAVVLLLLAMGAAAWWWFARPGAVEVRTAPVRQIGGNGGEGMRTVLNASGYVTARRQATVSAKVTGKVIEVLIEEGLKVKEGQVLARLDDSNIKTSLDVAEAQLGSTRLSMDETRAQLKQADLEFKRETGLAEAKIASQSDLDKAESDAMTLRARLARQQLDITTAERQVTLWKHPRAF